MAEDKAIPDDVLIEIFLKLPLRSLLSFRSVSKHWHSLIQNPNFINLLNTRPFHSPMLILRTVESKTVITLLYDDQTLPYKDDVSLDTVFSSVRRNLCLLGPCNGLFCITDTFKFAVFNPTTKRCRRVPFPGSYSNVGSVGFGFDHVSNDYKVVSFCGYHESRFETIVYRVEIFSLSTNSWRKVKNVLLNRNLLGLSLFVNGAFHCFDVAHVYDSIIVFDLNKESFKEFDLPDTEESCFSLDLFILNESLAVALNKHESHVGYAFDIWVMMEYGDDESWKNLYSISTSAVKINGGLSFGKDGEFLLENRDGKLVSFNLNTSVIKEFQIQKPIYAFRYIESLVSLKKC